MRFLMMHILFSVHYGEEETRIYSLTEGENTSKLSCSAPDTTQLSEAGDAQIRLTLILFVIDLSISGMSGGASPVRLVVEGDDV